ncbi:hypothetical protein PINS_up014476 [Pythium insidiosum]|nr:hypothetical protein PINS_up014476 [Pythium insidiosum]
MGMACESEGRSATTLHGSPVPTAVSSPVRVPGKVEQEGKASGQRSRSNSEETALILTSMSQGKFGSLHVMTNQTSMDGVEDDARSHSDMEDDLSGDDHDESMDTEPLHFSSSRVQHYQDISVEGPVHYDASMSSKIHSSDEAAMNHRFRHESNRVKSLVTKHITIDELRAHFDRPIIDVAKDFGICITLMKKICRRNGIKRWPHRQIRSLSKSIASMEAAMLSAQGPERDKYRDQIISLKLKRDAVIADPNKEGSMNRPKTPTKDAASFLHTHGHTPPRLSPRAGPTGVMHHQHQAPTMSSGISLLASTPLTSMAPSAAPSSSLNGGSHSKGGRWTSEEHAAFLEGIRLYGKDWRRVAQVVSTRSAVQTRTHAQKYLLKFAGRFPFDTEGNKDSTSVSSGREASEHRGDFKDEDASTSGPGPAKKSSVEAMAMLLNSPASTSASPPMNPSNSSDAASPRGPVSLQMLSSVQTMAIASDPSAASPTLSESTSRAPSVVP